MDNEAFVESQTEDRPRPPKSIKLPLNSDGSINWDATSEKHASAFIEAIKVDPNGILANIQEEAGQTVSGDSTGIADATVLAGANLVMVIEAIAISVFPAPRFFPALRSLHPVVAIKACTVSMQDIEPIKEPAKRIIKRYVSEKYLGQEYQDIAVCAEHLAKVGAEKFKACLALAMEIDRVQREGEVIPPNGRGSKVEVH